HPFTKDPTENALWKAWAEGWEQGHEEAGNPVTLDDDADLSDPDAVPANEPTCLDDRDDLSDADEEE
ncbi:hypothetical protein JIN85_19790, partial [Luteolibacter pohnpeiensis]